LGAKRLAGRKRHILVDANGLVLAVKVHGVDLLDRDGGRQLLAEDLQRELPRLELVWADGACTSGFRNGRATSEGGRWRCRITATGSCDATGWRRSPAAFGSYLGARRWVVERTFAWLSQACHLSKDYERLPETGEAMIYGVMSRIMLRRLTWAA
jgi:putative transposase